MENQLLIVEGLGTAIFLGLAIWYTVQILGWVGGGLKKLLTRFLAFLYYDLYRRLVRGRRFG